ncbi:MAG: radical SAM protein [Lentisphaeria bacterium]
MPLGLACLAALARDQQEAALDLFDANLELWQQLCDSDPQLDVMRTFFQGSLDLFLSPSNYAAHLVYLSEARRKIDLLEQQAREYLEGNGLASELQQMLQRHTKRITCQKTVKTIAFSAMFLDQLPFLLAQAKFLVQECNCESRIIIGGAAMSALSVPEFMTAAPFIDAVLIGEGEIAFRELLKKQPLSRVPGCYYRDAGGIRFSGSFLVPQDLSQLCMPDFTALAGKGYFNPVPVLPISASRGCNWHRCRFCTHNSSFGGYRQRPPRLVALEMLAQRNRFNCRHFYFVDQYVDPQYLNELCDAILELGLDCRFQIMARTVAAYTPELLHKAAEAGCCWISWGVESGSQKLLNLMNKGTCPEIAQRVIRDASAEGISNLLMMIFGAPGSDASCLEETFSFLDRVWKHIDGMTASAFVLFEQTEFASHPEHYGLEILGDHISLKVEGRPIHDLKLRFRREFESGQSESPLAAMEIDKWERYKAWLPALPFHGRLCCEHYLIFADAVQANYRPRTKPRSA